MSQVLKFYYDRDYFSRSFCKKFEEGETKLKNTHVPFKKGRGVHFTVRGTENIFAFTKFLQECADSEKLPYSKRVTAYLISSNGVGIHPSTDEVKIWHGHNILSTHREKFCDFDFMMIAAVRYACGRMSYAPALVTDFIKEHWWDEDVQRKQKIIIDSIEDSITFIEEMHKDSDDPDYTYLDSIWKPFLNWCKAEYEANLKLENEYGKH